MMKIGIFGGSFNPPHKMHVQIAEYLIKNKYLDKIIYVPTGNKYSYKTNLIADTHRYNMLKIIADKHKNIEVSDYEMKTHMVYTYETLNYFKNKYNNDKIYLICGADNLDYIDKWKNADYILNNFDIIAIKRENYDISNLLNQYSNIIIANIKMDNISSTKIRSNIKDHIKELDKDVYNYIIMNNLYEGEYK